MGNLGPAAETTIMISSEDPMPARASPPRTLAPAPAGVASAGGLPAPGDTWGTAVVTAWSLMGHAPAGSIPDGTDQPPEQPPLGPAARITAGRLAHDRERPTAGAEFRRAPAAGQKLRQK